MRNHFSTSLLILLFLLLLSTSADAHLLFGSTSASSLPTITVAEFDRLAVKPLPAETELDKRLTLFIALIVLLGVLLKSGLLIWRLQKNRQAVRNPQPPTIDLLASTHIPPSSVDDRFFPDIDQTTDSHVSTYPKDLPKNAEPVATSIEPVRTIEEFAGIELVVESGNLGPGKVPALLKRCAEFPEPVTLYVKKGLCEKFVYFAGGQVTSAHTQNGPSTGIAVDWKQLGSLLIREKLIREEEFQQGLALLEAEPGLRLGQALLRLGFIDLPDLRQVLIRQAKVTLYALILFSEGYYRVTSGETTLPPEESISLEINRLIRDASHHQLEWTAIRKALPSLNTVLDYQTDGNVKINQVHLSEQQQMILSLIDGQRSINDLFTESAMMDYELYRFLYLMIKAGVLKTVAATAQTMRARAL